MRKQRPTASVCSEQNETVREKGVRACVACMVSFFLSPFDSSQSSNRNMCQWGGRAMSRGGTEGGRKGAGFLERSNHIGRRGREGKGGRKARARSHSLGRSLLQSAHRPERFPRARSLSLFSLRRQQLFSRVQAPFLFPRHLLSLPRRRRERGERGISPKRRGREREKKK